MAKTGPIVIVEDDIDDQEIVAEVIKELGVTNEVIFFELCSQAFTFLKSTNLQPFIILCDINLPKINGLDFKMQIDNDPGLRQKSVPFIFFSTAAGKQVVTDAFTKMTVQGFFQKTTSFEDLKKSLTVIMDYWKLCKHPNSEQ